MELGTRTMAVHAGRNDLARLGVHAPPLDLSSTYPLLDHEQGGLDLGTFADGAATAGNPVYSRLHNPTVARFENALAELEGTDEAVAYASGMAAITAVIMASARAHVIALRPIYGGTDHLLGCGLLSPEVTYINGIEQLAGALRPDTGLILLETPANPCLDMIDIAEVVRIAGEVPVAVDNTFATPILQNPAKHGAAYVIHSATKYLSGHGDVLGGVVACSAELAGPLRQIRILTGSVLHPLAGYLLHRGLPTLPLRVLAAQHNAGILAERLATHPAVAAVHYPGLPGADAYGLLGSQLSGAGSIISFETYSDPIPVIEKLNLITPAVSLGSVDTLIQHPASLTHRLVPEQARRESGISPLLLRLAVGIEDANDLWADLDTALNLVLAA
ncbi:PLP-dependent transferase [Pseudonocardiaceae bacterium YIM PH 21723]|nr:PLP-dependent transferase [Pseudonocardiaceae bacterium YIM PH 21723]